MSRRALLNPAKSTNGNKKIPTVSFNTNSNSIRGTTSDPVNRSVSQSASGLRTINGGGGVTKATTRTSNSSYLNLNSTSTSLSSKRASLETKLKNKQIELRRIRALLNGPNVRRRSSSRSRPRSSSKSRSTFIFGPRVSLSKLPTEGIICKSQNVVLNRYAQKFLPIILKNCKWSQLFSLRLVCKDWMNVIARSKELQKNFALPTIRYSLHEAMLTFNLSTVPWISFRIYVNAIYSFQNPTEEFFWEKYGDRMKHLEIKNRSLTVIAFMDILKYCKNLITFNVSWSTEMYSFNPDLIKKYYGVSFEKDSFSYLTNLTIERSNLLTDNALWSILKSCGSSLQSLSLVSKSSSKEASDLVERKEDILLKLKPQWTIDVINNYFTRYSYAKSLQFLDFSGSRINSADLILLTNNHNLMVKGLKLSGCKVEDKAIRYFLQKKNEGLESFYVDGTIVSENGFMREEIVNGKRSLIKLQDLKILDISGDKGNFKNIEFLKNMENLEEFHCSETNWFDFSSILQPLEELSKKIKNLKVLTLNGQLSKKITNVEPFAIKKYFTRFASAMCQITNINLSSIGSFGTDDNFLVLCEQMRNLERLSIREWKELTDEGFTGCNFYDLDNSFFAFMDFQNGNYVKTVQGIKLLQKLKFIDIAGCTKLSNFSISFGLLALKDLKNIVLEGTLVNEDGLEILNNNCKKLEKVSIKNCRNILSNNMRRPHNLQFQVEI